MAESEEELKSFLMKVKEESEKADLKLSIQKTKIMASSPITLWHVDGETMETVKDFIFLGSKVTVDGDRSHEIKTCLLHGKCESAALNMPANLENSAVAIGLEKVSFHSNAKECSSYCTIALISWHPRRRQWHPPPVLLPGKSHGRRSLVGCSPWSCEESDMTELLHFPFSLSCIGEGNGNPLQCSCLENPRDGGAW